jgi:hypothetical protein
LSAVRGLSCAAFLAGHCFYAGITAMHCADSYFQKHTQHTRQYYCDQIISAVQKNSESGTIPVSVVVPLYNEYPGFCKTVASLEESAAYSGNRMRVVCVVNNRADDSGAVKENNRLMLAFLRAYSGVLDMHVIDASSPGREIPAHDGVGLARKIGMDFAAAIAHGLLFSAGHTPADVFADVPAQGGVPPATKFPAHCIACLDGDTLVSKNYAASLTQFAASGQPAALTGCRHRTGETPEAETAIRLYENFLRRHSCALKAAGTPFYHIALGPTIVCSASAYCACGGMNTHTAGEDFYFLQALIKICPGKNRTVETPDCTVYPESRLSDRTPFGTGQKIARAIENLHTDSQSCCLPHSAYGEHIRDYPDAAYGEIAFFISLIQDAAYNPHKDVFTADFASDHRVLYDFLSAENFFSVWEKIKRNNCSPKKEGAVNAERLIRAFHTWFDGLKIIRFIHSVEKNTRL